MEFIEPNIIIKFYSLLDTNPKTKSQTLKYMSYNFNIPSNRKHLILIASEWEINL